MNQFILPVLKPDPNRRHPKWLLRIYKKPHVWLTLWIILILVSVPATLLVVWQMFGLNAMQSVLFVVPFSMCLLWIVVFAWTDVVVGREDDRFHSEVVVPLNLDDPNIYFVVNSADIVTRADPGPYDSSQVTVVRINPYALYDCDAVEVGYPLDLTDQHVVTPWKLKVSFGEGLVFTASVEKLWRVWQLAMRRSWDGKPDIAPFLLYYTKPRGDVLRVECTRV